jgi:hypothetical protein
MLANLRKRCGAPLRTALQKIHCLMRKPACGHGLSEYVNGVNVGRRQDAVEGGAHEARRLFVGGRNGRPTIIASRGVMTSSYN